jgi:hypothetical protein
MRGLMKRFKDWVEIFYPRYLMQCVEIIDTVLDFLCVIFKKGLAMHPLFIWKGKSGWFLFLMSLGLSVATEIVLTAARSITDFQPKFCSKSTPHDNTEPMKFFLAHTMVFVGSIWKGKSGWFPFVPGAVSGHRNCADYCGVHH